MRSRSFMRHGAAAIGAVVLLSDVVASQQARDAQSKPVPVGTALISGTVVTDETPSRPLRRVGVTLTETGNAIMSRLATTDEAGRFVFRNLPAGRYTLSSARPPFLVGAYGARRPAGPGSVQTGTAIVLGDAQQITNIAIKMLTGAVITGILRDVDGQPARGYQVSVAYFQRSSSGERRLVAYYGGSGAYTTATTDDRGVYRLYGLSPGDYIVSASNYSRQTDVTITTDADVQRAMSLVQRPSTGTMSAGLVTASATVAPAPRKPTVGYVPVYFPGTTIPAQASTITLGVGEERSGADFQLQLVSTARVEGTIIGTDGAPATDLQIRAVWAGADPPVYSPAMNTSATSNAQGRFTLNGLPPGSYVLDARTTKNGVALWAASEINLQGEDTTVNLALQPGLTVSGRIQFDATTEKPPQDLSKTRVSLSPVAPTPSTAAAFANAQANGEFSIAGVSPGRYRLNAPLAAPNNTKWFPKSSLINGQDSLDVVEIRPGERVTDATVLLTDRPTQISGRMTDAANNPAPEYFIIVFAADRSHWVPSSRRIMQTRPSHDGTFTFSNLPPGEYRIAAVTDVEQGEWYDPTFLAQLFDASIRVTLAEHGKVTQDIRLR